MPVKKGVQSDMAKKKSAKQIRYLMSKGSPLSEGQKDKLKGEMRSGSVKVKKPRKP